MIAANDTTPNANFNNGTLSIALSALGGEFVVSVFLCGRDGEADLENGALDVQARSTYAEAAKLFAAYRTVSCFAAYKKRRKAMLARTG